MYIYPNRNTGVGGGDEEKEEESIIISYPPSSYFMDLGVYVSLYIADDATDWFSFLEETERE